MKDIESLRDKLIDTLQNYFSTTQTMHDRCNECADDILYRFKKELSALPPAVKLNSYNEAEAWCNKTPMFMPKTLQQFINFQHQAFVAGMETYQYKSVQNSALPDIEVYIPDKNGDSYASNEKGGERVKKVRLSSLSGDIEVKSDAVEFAEWVDTIRYSNYKVYPEYFYQNEEGLFCLKPKNQLYQLFKGDAPKSVKENNINK